MKAGTDWHLFTGGHLGQIWIPYNDYGTQLPVTALTSASSETVWAVFRDVIVVYSQQQWQRVANCSHILADNNPVHSICWWRDLLWLAGKGLWTYDNGVLQRVVTLPDDRVIAIHCYLDRQLVVGFQHAGVWCSVDGQEWIHLAYPDNLGRLHALTCDDQGQIWITVQGEEPYPSIPGPIKRMTAVYTTQSWTTAQLALWHYDNVQQVWIASGIIPKPARVITMTVDSLQRVRLGTEGDGIWRWDKSSWVQIRRTARQRLYQGLPSNMILILHTDSSSRVWSVHLHGLELGVCEVEIWRSAYIAPAIIDNGDTPLVWVPNLTTAAYYQSEPERLWIGTGMGEVGWIDVHATNQVVPSQKTINYQPIRVDIL